jgi:hypothetical protein
VAGLYDGGRSSDPIHKRHAEGTLDHLSPFGERRFVVRSTSSCSAWTDRRRDIASLVATDRVVGRPPRERLPEPGEAATRGGW